MTSYYDSRGVGINIGDVIFMYDNKYAAFFSVDCEYLPGYIPDSVWEQEPYDLEEQEEGPARLWVVPYHPTMPIFRLDSYGDLPWVTDFWISPGYIEVSTDSHKHEGGFEQVVVPKELLTQGPKVLLSWATLVRGALQEDYSLVVSNYGD